LLRSEPWPSKRHVEVLGARIAYSESGSGRPIVFVHGNPTSSVIWRDVIPAVSSTGRCLALDLIGMGDSSKVGSGARSYRFLDHRTYLDAFMSILEVDRDVILVGHEWGAALLFDWARRNSGAVAGIAYMETFVTPLRSADLPDHVRPVIQALRTDAGDELVLAGNLVVERLLQAWSLDALSDATLAEYRRPFAMVGEDRRPSLTWPREMPLDGEPSAVVDIVADYEQWLASNPVPKLFVNAEPGLLLTGRARDVARRFPNQTEITVPGIHFLQEDSGREIGRAIAEWAEGL